MVALTDAIKILIQRIKGNRLFADSFWALFGSSLGKGLSILSGILIARILGKDIYGEYGVLQTTLIQLGMFSTFGLGYTATKYVAEYNNSKKSEIRSLISLLFSITLVTSSVLSTLVFAFSEPLATFIKAPGLAYPIRLCSIVIILNGVTLTQVGILSGLNMYKLIAKNNTLSGVLSFVLCCGLTYPLGFNGAIYSLLISQLFNCLINRLSIKKTLSGYEKTGGNTWHVVRNIISFSFPVALQESCVFIFGWLSTYSLIKYSTYGEIGLHSAAAQWSAIILFVPGVLRNVTLSHLSGSDDNNAHVQIMKSMLITNFISTIFPYFIVVLSLPIIVKFYGPSYSSLGIVMLVLNASTIPNCMSNVYVQEFMSINHNWPVFITRVIKDSICLITTISLLKNTMLGGALSLSISVCTSSILYYFALKTIYSFYSKSELKS